MGIIMIDKPTYNWGRAILYVYVSFYWLPENLIVCMVSKIGHDLDSHGLTSKGLDLYSSKI